MKHSREADDETRVKSLVSQGMGVDPQLDERGSNMGDESRGAPSAEGVLDGPTPFDAHTRSQDRDTQAR